jgi:hypothetical protein
LDFALGDGDTNSASLDLSAGLEADLNAAVAGGAGDDTVDVEIGSISEARATIHVDGFDGEDDLSVIAANLALPLVVGGSDGPLEGSADASLKVALHGGWGNDSLSANLAAAAESHLGVDMDGGGGDDEVLLSIVGETVAEAAAPLGDTFGGGIYSARREGIFVDLGGGSGDDTVSATLASVASHHVKIDLSGDSGDDDVSLVVGEDDVMDNAAASGSTGNANSQFSVGAGLYADLRGGGGDDTLSAELAAMLAGTTHVDLHGGSGDDEMSFVSTSADVAADASLRVRLDGASGDDELVATVLGQILGRLKFEANGGPGDDAIESNLTAAAGSTGILHAKSGGDSGSDEVTLNVFDLSGGTGSSLLAELEATIFDPGGHDLLTHTSLVEVVLNNARRGGKGAGPGGYLRGIENVFDRIFGTFSGSGLFGRA